MDVLLIGYGAIAQEVLKDVQPGEDANIVAILVRPARVDAVRAAVAGRGIEVVSSFDDLTTKPQLVAECAGHAGVRDYGVDALRRGMDFLVISIGVLADAALYDHLVRSAKDGGAKLVLAAGAVAGADAAVPGFADAADDADVIADAAADTDHGAAASIGCRCRCRAASHGERRRLLLRLQRPTGAWRRWWRDAGGRL